MNDKTYLIAIGIYVGLAYLLALLGKPAELAGFAVVGALSLVFLKLESFKEFSGAGITAKLRDQVNDIQKDLEPIKAKATEPEDTPQSEQMPEELLKLTVQDEKAKDALLALTGGQYSWRTIHGVAKSTQQSPSEALSTLQLLIDAGLAVKGSSSSGRELWGPTVRGSIVGAMIANTSE